MRYKLLLVILASAALMACAPFTSAPRFPDDVQFQYAIQVKGENTLVEMKDAIVNFSTIPELAEAELVRCLEFEIVEKYPYKIKYVGKVALSTCNGVGGFKPASMQSILNWMDDIYTWAKPRRACLK